MKYQMRDSSTKQPVRAAARRTRTVSKERPPSRARTQSGSVSHQSAHVSAGAIAGVRHAPAHLISAVREGLRVEELDAIQSSLRVPMDQLLPIVGISKATFHRRKLAGRLDQTESDRVVRFARLIGRAIEVMESGDAGRRWLTTPQTGLGGQRPLDYAATEIGAREVEDLLGRIEFGVY